MPVRRALRAVLREVDPSSPWMAPCAGDHEMITVFEKKRGRVRVRFGDGGGREKWITVEALLEVLGVPNVAAEVDWRIPIPIAPLEELRFKETPYQRLRALLAGERTTLWVAVIYSVVIGLLSLVVPIAVQSLVNTVAFGSVLQPIVVLTVFVFLWHKENEDDRS